MSPLRTHLQPGFTLIELSIALIIIGLLVGGILVGQDLIKTAEVRATIGQIEKYNAAVNTFQGKYGGLPGDLKYEQAQELGFFTINFQGNGSGILQPSTYTGTSDYEPLSHASGEELLFWRHLSDASLVEGSFVPGANVNGLGAIIPTSAGVPISTYLPPAKLGRGNYIAVYGAGGINYYEISGIDAISDFGAYTVNTSKIMPGEAYLIDAKTDDGFPHTGNAVARGPNIGMGDLNQLPDYFAPPGAGFCVTGAAATDIYALSSLTPACGLRIRFN